MVRSLLKTSYGIRLKHSTRTHQLGESQKEESSHFRNRENHNLAYALMSSGCSPSWKTSFSQRYGQNVYPSSKAVGERRTIWLVRRWLINVFWKQWYLLFFCIISPSWVINLWNGYDTMDVPLPLRLSWIRYLAMFWDLKIYSMLESAILWYDLRE